MQIPLQPAQFERWCPTGRTQKQDWYLRREGAAQPTDWRSATDPDGNVRNRLSEAERLQWLLDMQEIIDFIERLPAGQLMDVGCGPGWLMEHLRGLGWECLGIEVADDACEYLHARRLSYAYDTHIAPDDCFDVVVSYHVLEHLQSPECTVAQLRRKLRKDGWFIVGTPDFASPCAKRFGDKYRMLHDPTHISLFTLDSMYRFLRDHGFTVHDVQYPFPDRYATPETTQRWLDTSKVSPPWPGNWMTFYAKK